MSLEDSSERPHKRAKMDQAGHAASKKATKSKSKYRSQRAKGPSQSQRQSNTAQITTVSASGIHNDDVGIFVTCDKGQERKCLLELSDLLSEQIPENHPPNEQPNGDKESSELGQDNDIEADILAELDALRPQPTTNSTSQKLSLITLDIACVSFVRFPTTKTTEAGLDPVEIVRNLCISASQKDSSGPRSRYVQRLTPVSLIRKTMNNGLESLCDKLLPPHFLLEPDTAEMQSEPATRGTNAPVPVKFAIRPIIRNNNKLDRDHVIRTVADRISALGHGKHTVDLKGYDKLVLVHVYRNVVGMSVVGSEYETLKRFNLSELHASHFDDDNPDREKEI